MTSSFPRSPAVYEGVTYQKWGFLGLGPKSSSGPGRENGGHEEILACLILSMSSNARRPVLGMTTLQKPAQKFPGRLVCTFGLVLLSCLSFPLPEFLRSGFPTFHFSDSLSFTIFFFVVVVVVWGFFVLGWVGGVLWLVFFFCFFVVFWGLVVWGFFFFLGVFIRKDLEFLPSDVFLRASRLP